jgi:hypothetical protein
MARRASSTRCIWRDLRLSFVVLVFGALKQKISQLRAVHALV